MLLYARDRVRMRSIRLGPSGPPCAAAAAAFMLRIRWKWPAWEGRLTRTDDRGGGQGMPWWCWHGPAPSPPRGGDRAASLLSPPLLLLLWPLLGWLLLPPSCASAAGACISAGVVG